MLNPNTYQKLWANWVAIVLSTISIIQGLAFNYLVTNLDLIITHTQKTNNYILLAHFILSFALLLRIFQTYIVAALDYDDWKVSLFDILTIFVVGVFEYYLFSSLSVANFDPIVFHLRLSLITIVGLAGYINAYFSVKREVFLIFHDYLREKKLQLFNILGILVVQCNSVLIIIYENLPQYLIVLLISISVITILFNIFYSVKITFLPRALKPGHLLKAEEISRDINAEKIVFSNCSKNFRDRLLNLFFQHFDYVYISIFDTSPRLSKKIVNFIFNIRNGKHPLGYKSFITASDSSMKDFYGFLLLNTRSDFNVLIIFYVFILSLFKIIFTLGIIGTLRVLFNLRMISNELWKCQPDELQITYMAIENDLQSKGIGSKFIEYAKDYAKKNNKKIISLEVREKNVKARQFFVNNGFTEIAVLNNEFDRLLQYGSRIIMQMKL